MARKDFVAEARASVLGAAVGVANVAAAEPPPPAPPVAPPKPPEEPEKPEEQAGPTYKDGDPVMSTDPRLPAGTITGEAASARCYTVTPHDGSDPYMAPESTLTPEEPMTDETTAPAALAESLGLPVGATLGQCTTAAAAFKAEAATARKDADEANAAARSQALQAAGVRTEPTALQLAESTLVRGTKEDGSRQTWPEAVASHKATHPFLYASAQPAAPAAPVVQQAEQGGPVEVVPAPATRPEANGPSAPLPAGFNVPGASNNSNSTVGGPVQLRGASMTFPGN